MLPSRRHLHALSRDPSVLLRAILIILGVFFLSALWLGASRPPAGQVESVLDQRVEKIRRALKENPLDRAALLRALRDDAARVAGWQKNTDGMEEIRAMLESSLDLKSLLAASALGAEEQAAFLAWHSALIHGKPAPELVASLSTLTMPDAPGLPLTMAADLKRAARDFQGALTDYETAGTHPEAIEARRRAVDLARNRGWENVLDRLLAQPSYQQAVHAVDDELSDEVARGELNVGILFQRTLDYTASVLKNTDYLILSLLTAAVWFISLHKACRLPRRRWWPALAAIPLGMFSTVITLVLFSLQEARGGLTDSDAAGPALLFQIASVGLREEISKLVCFLPLLFILRKGTAAQALMAASCVGLGFALKENISYFQYSRGSSVLGRFVTANFMHLAMTGLTGHALFKFVRYPKNYGPLFLATFVGMVMLHGFYNFSQSGFDNPFSRELNHFFPFIVAGIAWYYFQIIRQEQEDAPQTLSAHAVFLLGTAVILGALLNFLVWESGWDLAIQSIVPAFLSSVMFGWLFTHFLRDT